MSESLQQIMNQLWNTRDNAEWTPKTEVVALSDIQRWIRCSDIETLGFVHNLLSETRFRIEPAISIAEYIDSQSTITSGAFGRTLTESGQYRDT